MQCMACTFVHMHTQGVAAQVISSMGPPGGGRNPVTNRLLRHFNIIAFAEMSSKSVMRIFTSILSAFAGKYFNAAVQGATANVVAATVEIYDRIRTDLLPTPSKSHYTFNLRDMAKVIQGAMRADSKSVTTVPHVVQLWLHECARVFGDRLINDADHDWFRSSQNALLGKFFDTDWDSVVSVERLIYGDFMMPSTLPLHM